VLVGGARGRFREGGLERERACVCRDVVLQKLLAKIKKEE
jgi:hypothetical protein